LVVASSGDPSADEDAARMSYAAMSGTPIGGGDMHIFHMEYKESKLGGIIKSRDRFRMRLSLQLKKDIDSLLGRWI